MLKPQIIIHKGGSVKKTFLFSMATMTLCAFAGGDMSTQHRPSPRPTTPTTPTEQPSTPTTPTVPSGVSGAGLSFCQEVKVGRSGPQWQGNLLRETFSLKCKFSGSGSGAYSARSQKYLADLIEGLKKEHVKVVLDDGREVDYNGAPSPLANKFQLGPVTEKNWSYGDFFKLGLVVKEVSGRVVFNGESPEVISLVSGTEDLSSFWKAGGGVMYRVDTSSYNEDDEELKMRTVQFFNAGQSFFVQSTFTEGIYSNGTPHQYLKSVQSRYWTRPVQNSGEKVHVLDLRSTVTANYTGEAERHISRQEFQDRVLVPFGQTVERRVSKLVPALAEHF